MIPSFNSDEMSPEVLRESIGLTEGQLVVPPLATEGLYETTCTQPKQQVELCVLVPGFGIRVCGAAAACLTGERNSDPAV